MLSLPCPSCGAQVTFRSAALPAVVCSYCRTMVARSVEGFAAVGKVAELPFDVSPIQLGTTGSDEDGAFEVVGRIRWAWKDGGWNEWLLLYGDGSSAWLGEAMGQFMLQRERDLTTLTARAIRSLAAGEPVSIGTKAQIDGEGLVVADAREARCVSAEGELPFTAPTGWTVYSVDFRSRSGRCGTLQRDSGGASFYLGRYVELAELRPRNLRAIEGWPLPAYAA